MSKEKRRLKKRKDREKKVQKKLLRKRLDLRETVKLEKEVEELKKLQEPKLKPFRKSEDDTQHQLSN
jgi:hypothetical protein